MHQCSSVYRPLKRDKQFHKAMNRMETLYLSNQQNISIYNNDKDFLSDMIYHHQIAVEMAIHHKSHTINPAIQVLLRNIIWHQSKEIWHMVMILKNYDHGYWLQNDLKINRRMPDSKFQYYSPDLISSDNLINEKCTLDKYKK